MSQQAQRASARKRPLYPFCLVGTRVTASEHEAISQAASELGITVSELIRDALRSKGVNVASPKKP